MKNIIIDCETLGIQDTSVVPMFAALVTDDRLSIKDNLKNMIILHPSTFEQDSRGSTRDHETIKWWDKQPQEVQQIVLSQENSVSIAECYNKFMKFLERTEYLQESSPFIWQRGSKDLDWLLNLFAGMDLKLPWVRVRDIRTAIDVLGASKEQNGYMDADKVSDEGTILLMKLNENNKAHHPAYDIVRDFVFLRSLGLV